MAAGALLEREDELAVLKGALDPDTAGPGTVVTVSGDAGLGKTRLLEAAAAEAGQHGYRVVTVRGTELERDLGWGLATDALSVLLEEHSPKRISALMSGRAMLARTLLMPEAPEHALVTSAPAQLGALAAALTALTRRLASERALALIVDDAHWADPPSLRWLNHLAARVGAGFPVTLIVGFRPREPGGSAELLRHLAVAGTRRLQLGPLSLRATTALVETTLRDPEAAEAVHEVTLGNPFMIDQLLRHLGGAPVTPQAVREARPRELRSMVMPRIERLGAHARALSEAVAVLGGSADLSTAAALAGIPLETAADAAEQLGRAGIFADEVPLTFAHPLLRSVVADSLTAARTDLLHRSAANVLMAAGVEPPDAAVHLLSAERIGEPWAEELLTAAGRHSMSRGAPESAAAFFNRALLEPGRDARHELLLDYGRALLHAGREDALDVLRCALNETPDVTDQAAVALEFGDALMAVDRPEEAIAVYERGIEAIDELESPLRMQLIAQRALAAFALTDEPERTMTAVAQAMESASSWPAAKRRSALALEALVAVWSGQPADRCVSMLEAALEASRYGEDSPLEWGPDLAWLMASLAWCDAHGRRAEFLESVIERARARGALVELGLATTHRAYGLIRCGRVAEAERDSLAAIQLFSDVQEGSNSVATASALDALVARGDLDRAEQVSRASLPDRSKDRIVFLAFVDARARLRTAQGRLEEARSDLEMIGAEIEAHHFLCPGAVPWRSQLAIVRHMLGDSGEARRLAAEDIAGARAFGAPRALGLALIAAGTVEERDPATIALREAVEVLAPSPARLEHARALVALGSLLRRSRRRDEAISALRDGLDVAASCGAIALADAARAELKVAGVRPRRERIHGPDSLTEGEKRVAHLAAEGATNAEIAQKLFLSLRTVETHLTSIYRKLDIKGRPQLAQALDASGDGVPARPV